MVIHILLVGKNSGHIWNGLKEISPAKKVYLLHSGNMPDFKHLNEAKKLKKKIEGAYCPTALEKINPFEMSNIILKIREIVEKEVEESGIPLIRDNFAVGVTGGTNVMASGAAIGAMLSGVNAYYVLDDRHPPKRKKYAELLPIPPISNIKQTSGLHLKILEALSEESYTDIFGDTYDGMMLKTELRDKIDIITSTFNSAIETLKEKGLLKQIAKTWMNVPKNKNKKINLDRPQELIGKEKSIIRLEITALGKFQLQAGNTLTSKEIKKVK
jgi:hypothetical protein